MESPTIWAMSSTTPDAKPGQGHVLHITDCYDGGVSRAINDMATNARFLGHSLAFHGDDAPPPATFSREFKVAGGRFARMRQFRRILRQTRPSVVHLHSSWAGGFVRLGLRRGTPVIYQPHCYKFVDPSLPRPVAVLYRLLERALLPNTTVTVVLSPAEQREASSLGATSLAVVPNVPSLPPGQVSPEGMSRRRVVMVGRLAPQKDPAFFLEVVRECRLICPDMEAVWIGDGQSDMRSSLIAEGVVVTGWLSQERVAEVISQGGVYVHSARYEGLPLTVLEAAQRGVAVVLRRIDAFEGIEELPQLDSPAELADAVCRLLRDRRAYREAVAHGRRLLSKHTHQRQAQALRALYDR